MELLAKFVEISFYGGIVAFTVIAIMILTAPKPRKRRKR